MFVYAGSLTADRAQQGIFVHTLDPATGTTEFVQKIWIASPGYLAFSPDRTRLYAASRGNTVDGGKHDLLAAYTLDRQSGRLALLDTTPIPPDPAYVAIDATGSLAAEESLEHFGGRVDVLVNNAGWLAAGVKAEDETYEEIRRTLAINLEAPTLLAQRFQPGMVAATPLTSLTPAPRSAPPLTIRLGTAPGCAPAASASDDAPPATHATAIATRLLLRPFMLPPLLR